MTFLWNWSIADIFSSEQCFNVW